MNLNEISKNYFNLFLNTGRIEFFMMHRNLIKLNTNIEKQSELDKQQTEELSL